MTHPIPAKPDRPVTCPRCAYDQRGVVESWTDACPMSGTCTECGLEFIWAEVICPEKFEPIWCVEFRGFRSLPRRAMSTFLMSFRPWRFWSELKMSNDVRWGRLATYLVLLILPLLLVYVAEQTAVALKARAVVQQRLLDRQAFTKQNLARMSQSWQQYIASMSPGDPARAQAQAQLSQLQAGAAAPDTLAMTPGQAVFEAVFLPLSRVSSGTIVSSGGTRAYPSPRDIHATLMNSFGTTPAWWRWSQVRFNRLVTHTILQLSIFPGLPLAFLLLPISRRRAKVRWSHIIRIMLYGVVLPLVVYSVSVVLMCASLFQSSSQSTVVGAAYALFNLGYWIGTIAWWIFAIRNYLKIPHAWLVAPALAGIVVLVTLLGLFLFLPSLVVNV